MNRRYFVMGAAGALASTQVKSHMLASPNATVRIACVGVRGQGRAHLNQYSDMRCLRCRHLTIFDDSVLQHPLDIGEKDGKKPASYWESAKRSRK